MKKSLKILSLCVAILFALSLSTFATSETTKASVNYSPATKLNYLKNAAFINGLKKSCKMISNGCANAIKDVNDRFNNAVNVCRPDVTSPACAVARKEADLAFDSAIIVCALGDEGDEPAPIDGPVGLLFTSKQTNKNRS